MAYDFPASPTQGQQFSPSAGVSYVYNGYAWDLLSGPTAPVAPTRIVPLTSGSGTYTVTSGTMFIEVELVGGGAGGGGGGNGGLGTAGGNTTFGSFTANGGAAGTSAYLGGLGGSASGGTLSLAGGSGGGGNNATSYSQGGQGGASAFGGAGGGGLAGNVGLSAATNTGGGGGGGGSNAASNVNGGGGGGAGGYVRSLISSPASTYPYSVGVAGPGGTAGNGAAGGAGASGLIVVTEYGGSAPQSVTVPNIRTITASGTYTPSPGMVAAIVECVGGGSGGNGVAAPGTGVYFVASGGGSGGYSRRLLTAAQIGASQTVTIGAGGAGSVGGGATGAGGVTSFGSLCIANGGGSVAANAAYTAGAGGSTVGAVGDLVSAGVPGIAGGLFSSGGPLTGGQGGSSIFGGGALAVINQGNGTGAYGNPANNYGSGGGGGALNNVNVPLNGGPGSSGVCVVTEFILAPTTLAVVAGRVLLTTIEPGGTNVAVVGPSFLTSAYDEYEIVALLPSAGTAAALVLTLSTDGGSTFLGTNYAYAFGGNSSAALAFAGGGGDSQPSILLGNQMQSTNVTIDARIRVIRPWLSGLVKNFEFTAVSYNNTLANTWQVHGSGVWAGGTTAINALKFVLTGNINFATGSFFKVYGIR